MSEHIVPLKVYVSIFFALMLGTSLTVEGQFGDVQGDEVKVSSRFIVYTNRLHDEVNLFVGKRDDVLRRDPVTGWKIAKRTILLDQNVLLEKVITTFF